MGGMNKTTKSSMIKVHCFKCPIMMCNSFMLHVSCFNATRSWMQSVFVKLWLLSWMIFAEQRYYSRNAQWAPLLNTSLELEVFWWGRCIGCFLAQFYVLFPCRELYLQVLRWYKCEIINWLHKNDHCPKGDGTNSALIEQWWSRISPL
jgi:hypothetical protein